jgi:hypothetical protein
LLCTERIEIYTVPARDIGWTSDVIVVLRAVFVDRVVRVLGEVRADRRRLIGQSSQVSMA